MPEIEQRVLTPWAVLSALALSAALIAAAYLGAVGVAVVVTVAALTMTYGWPRLLDLPSPRGVQAVLLLAAAGVVGSALIGDGRDLRWLPVALAIALMASFLHQLLRRDGRARLVATLGGSALGGGVLASGACFVGVVDQDDGALLVTAAAIAVGLSTVFDGALQHGRFAAWALPLAVGVSAALAAGVALGVSGPVAAAFAVAVCAGLVSHAVRRLLTVVPTAAHAVSQVSLGAAALLSAGAVPYVGAWLVEWLATR